MPKKKAEKSTVKKKVIQATKDINKKRWALAAALIWGVVVLIVGLLSTFTGYATPIVNGLGSLYLGYSATIFGTLIGTVWALVDMFIGVYLLIWLYEILGRIL